MPAKKSAMGFLWKCRFFSLENSQDILKVPPEASPKVPPAIHSAIHSAIAWGFQTLI